MQTLLGHEFESLEEGCGGFGENAEEVHQDMPGLKIISHKERLDKRGLFSLMCQRLRGKMIEVSKMMGNIDRVITVLPSMKISNTRRHGLKISEAKFKEEVWGFFLKQRVADMTVAF